MDRRRLSYASVAGGAGSSSLAAHHTPERSGAFAHLMNPTPSPPIHSQSRGPYLPPNHAEHASTPPYTHTDPVTKNPYNFWATGKVSQLNWGLGDSEETTSQTMEGKTRIRPSYLKGSRYLQSVDAAQKVRLAKQRESGQKTPNQASLSKSSSNVSLHRMAPSHRGMTYEIVEHQRLEEDDGIPHLPSKWAEVDRHGVLEISNGGSDLKFSGSGKSNDHESAASRTDHPMPPQCGIYYYEVSVLTKGKDGMIGVGFSGGKTSLEKLPGWDPESWAYHGDDGKSFCCHQTGKAYGPTFTVGDIIGCGVNFRAGTAFFTKNGNFLGTAFKDLKGIKLYPSIGMKRPGAHVRVNFGQAPFMFDIDARMRMEEDTVYKALLKADIGKLHPSGSEAALVKDLVSQFLGHDGYVQTARSFTLECDAETADLKRTPAPTSLPPNTHDVDAVNRQQIRSAVLKGDIDTALRMTKIMYPLVLMDNPRLLFHLRCRKYVELMRSSITSMPMAREKLLSTKNPHKQADNIYQHGMEVDDADPRQGPWDGNEMDIEEDDRTRLAEDNYLEQALKYAQELKQDYKTDTSKEVTTVLEEIFALFAYEDPRNSPTAHLLDPQGRAPVAEELNSAILVSLGKASITAIERIKQQNEVLVQDISDHGGSGPFIIDGPGRNDIDLWRADPDAIPECDTNTPLN